MNNVVLPWVFAEENEEVDDTTIVEAIQNQIRKNTEILEEVEEL